MSTFETISMMILIVAYGCVFYLAGKTNLVELLIKSAEEKMKELCEQKPTELDKILIEKNQIMSEFIEKHSIDTEYGRAYNIELQQLSDDLGKAIKGEK